MTTADNSKTTPSSSAEQSTDSTPAIDRAGEVRQGEELDAPAVSDWLRQQGIAVTGVPVVTQYSGGASNWTYRLQYPEHDLILRRPPAGTKAKSAHDMVREYQVQHALAEAYPYVPEMVALCRDEQVIGCDFYLMQRVEGIIPRANLPESLRLSESQVSELCHRVIDALVALHQVDYQQQPTLLELGKGDGYCQRQVLGWDKRYAQAQTPNVPSFGLVRQWLTDNTPADSLTCVIHNDWRLDNVVLDVDDPTQVVAVLDWEMATLGDPLMDLGSALAYWVQADDNFVMQQFRRQPTHLAGMLTRQQVVDYYLEQMGLSVDNWIFYEVFGLFRLAGIAQQIYYRYYHQQTDNPAFKNFWIVIHVLHAKCLALIAKHEGAAFVAQHIQPKLDSVLDGHLHKLPEPVQQLVRRLASNSMPKQ